MSFLVLLVPFFIVCITTAQDNCCGTMEFDGNTYTLLMEKDDKPDPKCIDGCVYTMGGKNFCFAEHPWTEGVSNGFCQVHRKFSYH